MKDWFLTAAERGNPSSALPTWTEGNHTEAVIHGAEYFDRLTWRERRRASW